VDRVVFLHDGRARIFDGNYSYFRDKMNAEQPATPMKNEKSKQEFFEFKEQSKRRARHKREIENTRKKIAELEEVLAHTTGEIEPTIPADDWQQLHEVAEKKKKLENEIIDLYSKLEQLESTKLD